MSSGCSVRCCATPSAAVVTVRRPSELLAAVAEAVERMNWTALASETGETER